MTEINAQAGCVARSNEPPPRWWRWHRFPLVPQLKIKQEDDHNTWRFNFHWLVFRAWTSDAPMLGFQVEIETYGVQVRLHLPYLWVGVFIPLGSRIEAWAHRNLWRKTRFWKQKESQ